MIRDFQYQAEKEIRAKTNPRGLVCQKNQNFFDIFSKKDSDTLFLYQKYHYKIYLEEEQKFGHIVLYKMSLKELDIIK